MEDILVPSVPESKDELIRTIKKLRMLLRWINIKVFPWVYPH